MILVIGGAFQGKKAFAMSLTAQNDNGMVIDGAVCEMQELFSAKVITHFHQYIRRMMDNGEEILALPELIAKKNPELIMVSNELGYGIVPMDPADRAWREACGRICTKIAASSEQVYRVVCGIGTPLKQNS